MNDKIKKLFEDDWKKRDKFIYDMNRDTYIKRLFDLYDKAEGKWLKTWKIKYYEAYIDLDEIIDELKWLDNDTLKTYLDDYKWLDEKRG